MSFNLVVKEKYFEEACGSADPLEAGSCSLWGINQEFGEMKPLKECTVAELSALKSEFQDKIERNDGRLTAESSYELDYFLDMVEDIDEEIRNRYPR